MFYHTIMYPETYVVLSQFGPKHTLRRPCGWDPDQGPNCDKATTLVVFQHSRGFGWFIPALQNGYVISRIPIKQPGLPCKSM